MFLGLVVLSHIVKYKPPEHPRNFAGAKNPLEKTSGNNKTSSGNDLPEKFSGEEGEKEGKIQTFAEQENEKKLREEEIEKIFNTKVASQAESLDSEFPYFDPKTSTCVQCFENSFNCMTGFQRCLNGRCVRKNSPQCSYYPVGLLGGSVIVPNKTGAL